MNGTVLLIEDDDDIAEVVKLFFEKEGFKLVHAETGESGVERVRNRPPRAVLLDLGLPGIDGVEVCKRIRSFSDVPVIMLTARDEEIDTVVGLEVGADDYVTKPFEMPVLVARIRSALRRARHAEPEEVLHLGEVSIDVLGHRARRDGENLDLTPTEFRLLVELARRPQQVFTREMLLERVWGYDYLGDSRLVDVAIQRLRAKIEPDPSRPRLISTVRGVGYQAAR